MIHIDAPRAVREKFTAERDAVLRSLNPQALDNLMTKWQLPKPRAWIGKAPLILMHKLRIVLTSFTAHEKEVSREWLVENNCSTNLSAFNAAVNMHIEWYALDPDCAAPVFEPDAPEKENAGSRVDLSNGAMFTCLVELPYPAKGAGQFVVTCPNCFQSVALLAKGAKEDPRSVRIKCKGKGKPRT